MSEPTSLHPIEPHQRAVLERLWQLYMHDLSEFRGDLPDDEGRYRTGRLPRYLDEPTRWGYLVRHGAGLVGFVLVRGEPGEPRVLGEFFIVRAARRRRVGHDAAVQTLRRHPGRWEIAYQETNPAAARFWRRVATDVAGESWSEELRPVDGKPEVPPDTWLTLTC